MIHQGSPNEFSLASPWKLVRNGQKWPALIPHLTSGSSTQALTQYFPLGLVLMKYRFSDQ
jgi:hypothetical protein